MFLKYIYIPPLPLCKKELRDSIHIFLLLNETTPVHFTQQLHYLSQINHYPTTMSNIHQNNLRSLTFSSAL